ncbi:hypothetical protein LTR95_011319 [Oleoguttula sp. CCFEE 5521]
MTWIMVFQSPITELMAVVILEATQVQGTYCVSSLRPRYGHLWYMFMSTLSVVLAIFAILKFYGRMKVVMKARPGLWKVLCFKGIVFLQFVQSWIVSILVTHNVLKDSSALSYGDLTYGLPNVLMTVGSVLFSLAFWFACSASEYASNMKPEQQRLSFCHAMVDAMNRSDFILGIAKNVEHGSSWFRIRGNW